MIINLKIKADVRSLSLSQIYDLLQKYSLSKKEDSVIYDYNGHKFKIEVCIDQTIEYIITEVDYL